MGWTIIPTDGVEYKGNGKYVFTPQSQDTTYIITYTDGETSGTIEYTVKATDCMVCDCSKFTFTKIVSQIPAVGYDTDTLIGTLTGACISNSKEMDSYISPVVTEGNNAVESVSTATTDENTVGVYARIKSNPGDTRTIKIRFDITNSYMAIKESCPTEYSFTQAANACVTAADPVACFDMGQSECDTYRTNDAARTNIYVKYTGVGDCWRYKTNWYEGNVIGVTGNENGSNITITSNTESTEVTSKVHYIFEFIQDTSRTAESTVNIIQSVNECVGAADPVACFDMGQSECDTFNTSDAARTNIYVKYTGLGNCWRYKSNWYEGNVRDVTEGDNGSNITITSNTASTEVTSKVHYIFEFIQDTSITAESVVNIIQGVNVCRTAPEPTVCLDMMQPTCTAYTATSAQEMKVYAKFTGVGDCWRYKSYGKTGNVKQNGVTVDGNNSVIALSANTVATSTDSEVYYVFTNDTTGIDVTKTVKITQPAGCTCSDIDVIFKGDGAHKFDLNQQGNVELCQMQINSSCVNVSNDMFDYSASHFTQIRVGDKIGTSPDVYKVMADLPGLNNAESTSFNVKIGNNTCGPFMIYRTCFCGTDNCKVEFPDGSIETYPLHVDSTNGTYSHTSFGDKIYIPVNSLMDRDGNSVPATGTSSSDAYEVYTTDNNGQTWCKVYYYVMSNVGYLHYKCEDNTGAQRKATFTFKVPDNTILRSDVGAPERWVGKTCCSPFTVELIQSSVNHRFAKDGVCRKTGFSNYIEVDLNDPRENHSDLVDCN